jgi:hypothetical protein
MTTMTDIGLAKKMAEALGDDTLTSALGDIGRAFRQIAWAEEEIEAAQGLRPNDADVFYHAFALLLPTRKNMSTEFVYRSHCRELLRRAGRGEDTRPATWAEIVCACAEASMLAPLTDTGFGTYARAWNEAHFPMPFPDMDDTLKHVEGLHGAQIDDMLAELRRKLTVQDRTLKGASCRGTHFGEPAPKCRYYEQGNAKAA